jgi:hypothetical protein
MIEWLSHKKAQGFLCFFVARLIPTLSPPDLHGALD